jgi:hypothetical protein
MGDTIAVNALLFLSTRSTISSTIGEKSKPPTSGSANRFEDGFREAVHGARGPGCADPAGATTSLPPKGR